jgi:hypothetical protein
MTSPGKTAVVYSVTSAGEAGVLRVEEAAQAAVRSQYSSLTPTMVAGQSYLLGYNPAQDCLDVYQFQPSAPWLTPAAAKPVIGEGKDIVNAFTLGNQPYVSVYTAENGVFEVYCIDSGLSLSKPYVFYRNHELAVSKGFTTVKAFTQLAQVVILGYNMKTGYVAMYTASITPVSAAPGTPPLLMLPVWAHPWAPGWTRFAFFQFGGENFFLKTNVADPTKLNVNIDHILDTLSAGTVEVGSHLPLADALDLSNVEPFTLGDGDPYFVAYISKSGSATLNRFHSDCLGWTPVAEFNAQAGAAVVTPVTTADGKLFLVFA